MSLRHVSFACPILLLALAACDRSQPAAPSLEAGVAGAAGPTVKAPSNTNAVAVSESQIDVSWRDNSTNETGFEVHSSTSGPGGTFALRTSTGANVASYRDTGLTPSRQYCYKVRAFKRADGKTSYSGFSNTACATTLAPPQPNAPSATNAVPSNSSAIDVTWADNSANEDGFRVERSLDGGASWATVSTTAANVTAVQDGGRSSEQPVCYRVLAFNASGDSPPSNTDCTTPPSGPTSLTATSADQEVDLAWTDNSVVEDGYEVQRSADGVAFSGVADLPANSASYRDAAAASNTRYWYRVRAKKDGGFSDFSNIASAKLPCPPGASEICGNGIDDDCDGLVDFGDSDCACDVQECSTAECPPGYLCNPAGCCSPHCGDGVRNGTETDVDCGGFCETDCAPGQHCYIFADCASGVCVNDICQ
jgi:hypothetical protein